MFSIVIQLSYEIVYPPPFHNKKVVTGSGPLIFLRHPALIIQFLFSMGTPTVCLSPMQIFYILLLLKLVRPTQEEEVESLISAIDVHNPNYITAIEKLTQIYHDCLIIFPRVLFLCILSLFYYHKKIANFPAAVFMYCHGYLQNP